MVKLLVWLKWIWWSSQGDNHSFTSKTKFKIHHWGILYEKWEQGKGKKKKKKKTEIHKERAGHVLKKLTGNYWGLKFGCQKPPTYTGMQPAMYFSCVTRVTERNTDWERRMKCCVRMCVRGLLFKLMVHIIERTDHSVLGLIYTACYFTLIYGHYLHRIYGPLALWEAGM